MKKETLESCFLENIDTTTDPDNSDKANKFYKDYWGNHFKKSDSQNDELTNEFNLRGDTIISFATISGAMIRIINNINKTNISMPENKRKRLELIKNSENIEVELKNKFEKFYKLYHSLANFMPIVTTCKATNLNNIKGNATGKYRDFPDLFFKDIRNYYLNDEITSNSFKCAVSHTYCVVYKEDRAANVKYFESFGEWEQGWKQFVELNYLGCFFNDKNYEQFIKLAPSTDIDYFPYRERYLKKDQINSCIDEIEEFLDNAIKIIKNRAEILQSESEKFI